MNTSDFIASVKRAISVPTYQGRYSDDDFLAIANEEQQITILPLLTSMREDYLTVTENIAVTAGTSLYQIPRRAAGTTLRTVWFNNAEGSTYSLYRPDLEDSYRFNNNGAGSPQGFVVIGDQIQLRPTPAVDASLTLIYTIQPSKLVKTSRTVTINSLTANTVTSLITVPNNVTTNAGSNQIDITSYRPGYRMLVKNAQVTNIASNLTLTIAGFDVSNTLASAGVVQFDVLSTAGETSILQMPDEIQPVLILSTGQRILQGLGMPDRIEQIKQRLDQAKRAANDLLQPRVDGELPKVFNRNGLLQSRYTFRRFPSVTV